MTAKWKVVAMIVLVATILASIIVSLCLTARTSTNSTDPKLALANEHRESQGMTAGIEASLLYKKIDDYDALLKSQAELPAEISHKAIKNLLTAKDGLALRQDAIESPLSAFSLLTYARVCGAFPVSTEVEFKGLPDTERPVYADDCFDFFGSDVKSKADLDRLVVDWLGVVAGTGSSVAAVGYWNSVSSLPTGAPPAENVMVGDRGMSRKDHISMAISLVQSAAEKGNVDALLRLIGGYMYGDLVAQNTGLASRYARQLVELKPSFATIAWLQELIS
jgi:hypothetical protein